LALASVENEEMRRENNEVIYKNWAKIKFDKNDSFNQDRDVIG
jgi:hypothetical protein